MHNYLYIPIRDDPESLSNFANQCHLARTKTVEIISSEQKGMWPEQLGPLTMLTSYMLPRDTTLIQFYQPDDA